MSKRFGRCAGTRVLLLAVALTVPRAGYAQDERLTIGVKEPSAALEALERGEPGAPMVIRAAFRENHGRYTDAERRELLDGLEAIAARGTDRGEMESVRAVTTAFTLLRSVALRSAEAAVESREIPMRILASMSRRSDYSRGVWQWRTWVCSSRTSPTNQRG